MLKVTQISGQLAESKQLLADAKHEAERLEFELGQKEEQLRQAGMPLAKREKRVLVQTIMEAMPQYKGTSARMQCTFREFS